jgi:hypothetical protein
MKVNDELQVKYYVEIHHIYIYIYKFRSREYLGLMVVWRGLCWCPHKGSVYWPA